MQARYGALRLRERLTGTVRAAGQVAIYPETGGPIVDVLANNGDQLSAGDPLVRIRAESSRSQLQRSRAGLSRARAEREQAAATVAQLERACFHSLSAGGVGANLQAALARVVIGGLLASTLITLVLVPTLYLGAHRGLTWVPTAD